MNHNTTYEFGFICGRFGHADLGHKLLFDKGLQLCEKVYIGVGSAQEKGTLRNPFPVETRINVIKGMYPDVPEKKLIVDGIKDMSNELNRSTSWGTYLKKHIIDKFGMFPDLILYGREGDRSKWFEDKDMIKTDDLIVSRGLIPISGTMMRGFLLIDDKKSWQENVPEAIYHMYSELREELLSTVIYKEIYDKVLQNKIVDIDVFMNVYNLYVKEDRKKKENELKKLQK